MFLDDAKGAIFKNHYVFLQRFILKFYHATTNIILINLFECKDVNFLNYNI